MKKLLILICTVFVVASALGGPRIAVLDFNAGAGVTQADVDGLSAIFNTYFSPSGYTLIERTQIDRVIDEHNFQRGKLTQSQMVRIGQILNVSKVVIGDINVVMGQYNVDARIVDVESGTIIAKEGATWSPDSSYRTMMEQLATSLADKIEIEQNCTPAQTVAGEHGQQEIYDESLYAQAYKRYTLSTRDEHLAAFNQGTEAFNSKDYALAIAFFESIINSGAYTGDETINKCILSAKKYISTAYMNLGVQAASRKHYGKAIEFLTEAATKGERYGYSTSAQKAKVLLSKVYCAKGGEAFNKRNYTSAAEEFKKACNAHPANAQAALNLAICYCEIGKINDALPIFDKICNLPTEDYSNIIEKAKYLRELYIRNYSMSR